MMVKDPYVRGMWEYFLQERSRINRFRELADEEKQAGIQGQWQLESPVAQDKEESQCLTCARTATVSHWKTTFAGSLVKMCQVCAICGEKYD